jgi:hypothetical protein
MTNDMGTYHQVAKKGKNEERVHAQQCPATMNSGETQL